MSQGIGSSGNTLIASHPAHCYPSMYTKHVVHVLKSCCAALFGSAGLWPACEEGAS